MLATLPCRAIGAVVSEADSCVSVCVCQDKLLHCDSLNSATTIDLLMSFLKLEMEMEVEMDFFDTIKLDRFFL